MEKRYEGAKNKYDRALKEKEKAEDRVRESRAIVDSQRLIISEMSSAYKKAKAVCREKQIKLCDYRGRLKKANNSIREMKDELGDNAVNIFLNSDEFSEIQEETFDKAVKDVRTLLLRSYPDFNFSAFDADVKKATESRVRKKNAPIADKSVDFTEEPISEDEPEVVSSDDERFVASREDGKRVRRS